GGGGAVVALAAEEKVGNEKIANVLRTRDSAVAPVVQLLHAIAEYSVLCDLVAVRFLALVAKFINESPEQGRVNAGRIEALHCLLIALFPMRPQPCIERDPPGGAAFEKSEAQVRKAAGNAPEKQGLANCFPPFRETAELVVLMAAGRRPSATA